MKPNELAGRLRREIAASPKKAAILGLLVVVAVVYWSPLVWGWIAPKSADGTDETAKATPASTAPVRVEPMVVSTTPVASSGGIGQNWKETSQWIQSDPRMTATADVPGRPHPFDPIESPPREPGKEAQVKERQNAENAAAQAVLDPTTLGAVLFSTVVGPQGRAALISGKSYRLGSVVRLDHEGKTIDFLLTEIRSDGIVLQRGEKRFEILLPEPSTLDRMEINVLQEP